MILIYVTCKDAMEAAKIARTLVSEKLAVCANIIEKINSVYRWKGEMKEQKESLLVVKTTAVFTKKVFTRIKQIHTYECPEMISFKSDVIPEEIRKWTNQELSG